MGSSGILPLLICAFTFTFGLRQAAEISPSSNPIQDNWKSLDEYLYRLPNNLRPSSYNILLLPILEPDEFRIEGLVSIDFECIEDTDEITLNAVDIAIDINSVQVWKLDTDTPVAIEGVIDEQYTREMITFQTASPGLQAGNEYKITMSFNSSINDELRGFYKSSYESKEEVKYLGVTQLAATHARRVFPCFDEPNMKAIFYIGLGRKSTMRTAFNTARQATFINPERPGYVWDDYATTPVMSTYTLAVLVSDFVAEVSDSALSPGVRFSILARPGLGNQTKYAGNIGPRMLNYFSENVFEIPYALTKMEMAAVPDLAVGAMENWGLITFKESNLLVDEKRSSAADKQRVAEIIAHELAHQWLGNLVTMDWWDSVWLNEGLASFFSITGVDHVNRDFGISDQFLVKDLHNVMITDAFGSSRPINFLADSSSEIHEMFDVITYKKGASLLRMLARLIGHETLRKGVVRYLNASKYGNTDEDDLWNAIGMQASEDQTAVPFGVKAFMNTWTNKKGYPVVTVERNFNNGRATIKQERFQLWKTNNPSPDTTVYRWHIPLTYTSNFTLPPRTNWLSVNSANITVLTLSASSDQWVIFNVDQAGYYRVAYDDTNMELIRNQLQTNHEVIPELNRAQILDDYLNLARAKTINYSTIAMDLTKYLVNEKSYIPWMAASTNFKFIDAMLFGRGDYSEWKDYVSGLISSLHDHVSFNPKPEDSHSRILTRSIAVDWACGRLGLTSCVLNARSLFNFWMANPTLDNLISPDLREPITCTAVSNGGQPEWNFVYRMYNESTLASEKLEFLRSLACSRSVTVLYSLLEKMITPDSGIRKQDADQLFASIASSSLGHQIALDFLRNRWDDIAKQFGNIPSYGGKGGIPGFFRSLCDRVNTQAKLNTLERLVIDHPGELLPLNSVQQGLDLARSNLQWIRDNYDDITEWLKNQKAQTTTEASNASTITILSTSPSESTPTIPSTTAATSPTSTSTATSTTTTPTSTSTVTMTTTISTSTSTVTTTQLASTTTTKTITPFSCPSPTGMYPSAPCSGLFYMCSNNIPFRFECPYGGKIQLVYNPKPPGYCDYPDNVPGC